MKRVPRRIIPPWMILVSALVSLLMYGIGVYILMQYGIIRVFCYLVFILIFEYRLIGGHCTDAIITAEPVRLAKAG